MQFVCVAMGISCHFKVEFGTIPVDVLGPWGWAVHSLKIGSSWNISLWWINIDPEKNNKSLVEPSLPSPIWQGRTVDLLDGITSLDDLW
jgi:hypothetical protein